MATKIVTKNSSTAGAAPTATDLVQGELAVNVADGRLYTEDNAAAIVELGVNPATEITANAGIALPDNQKATFGDGGDLELFYNGTHSVFKDGSAGNIYIQDDNNIVLGSIGGENYLVATKDAAVTLYYDAAPKLATTSTGIDVTGTVTMDGLVSSGDITLEFAGVNSDPTGARYLTFDNTDTTLVAGQPLGGINWEAHETYTGINASIKAYAAGNTGEAELRIYTGQETEAMRIDNSGNVGIGGSTITDANLLNIQGSGASKNIGVVFNDTNTSKIFSIQNGGSALKFFDYTASQERMRIGSTGIIYVNGDGTGGRISGDGSGGLVLQDGNGRQSFKIMSPSSGSSQAMTLDASGDLLVGVTSSGADGGVSISSTGYIQARIDNDIVAYFDRTGAGDDGEIVRLQQNGTAVGSIGTRSGLLKIGNGDTGLAFNPTNDSIFPEDMGGTYRDAAIDLGVSAARFKDLYLSGVAKADSLQFAQNSGATGATEAVYRPTTGAIAFKTNSAERMRIDASGNLLVGGTTTTPHTNSTTPSTAFMATGEIRSAANGSAVAQLNRTISNGDIITLRKNGITVGSIGTINSAVYIGTLSENSGITFQGTALQPTNGAQNRVDNTNDIGSGTYRWDDIYATNGTIQTSDRNEKQDIEELSTSETAVAVACKGLLRKFRWKDSVAEKGDEARTHFGIIAQDLQAAFAAEGLDAGDYAMFISTTWTDEETNEEKTRMGVRYSELLAFIIAAI